MISPVAKRGLRFLHARVFDPQTGQPRTYVVTRVARRAVYYRPVYAHGLGVPEVCDVAAFPQLVKEIVAA